MYEELLCKNYVEYLHFRLHEPYFKDEWSQYILATIDILIEEENDRIAKIAKDHYLNIREELDNAAKELANARTRKGKVVEGEVWINGERFVLDKNKPRLASEA